MPDRILVMEPDDAIRGLVCLVLTEAGYAVSTWNEAAGAEAHIMALQPDLVKLSLRLAQQGGGLALLATLAANSATRTIPLLICSGDLALLQAHADEWRAQGYGVLLKPFKLDELLALVRSLLDDRQVSPTVP